MPLTYIDVGGERLVLSGVRPDGWPARVSAHASERCPICDSGELWDITERSNVPVHQNMLYESRKIARTAKRGHLRVVACVRCSFAFNATFDESLMSYGVGYEADQSFSPAYSAHVDELLHHLLNERGVRGSHIVEVGSGKGGFLRALVAAAEAGNTGVGFDPSYEGVEHDLEGQLRFVRSFYSTDLEHASAEVAIFRHVLEHVANPVELLTRVREGSNCSRVFMETKDVKWVLRNAVIWDFFYEYCSYFSQRSVASAFRHAGFGDVASRHVFGGQYLWIEVGRGVVPATADMLGPSAMKELIISYRKRESETLAHWCDTLATLRDEGPVALWGAGAKGVTFTSLFDPDAEIVSCVVDLNPAKQGRFIAGSGHPIVSPAELKHFGVKNVVLLNPNYAHEVRERLARDHSGVKLVVDADTLGIPELAQVSVAS